MFAPRGWLKRPVARRIYRTIATSNLFDARWYRSTQVSELASLMDPLWHYLDHGAAAGLDPSPRFDTSHYVHAHHDVRSSGLNPLFHYLEYGIEERRSPLRSALGTRNLLLPEAKELETFTSPRLENSRVTMLVDSRATLELSATGDHLARLALEFSRQHSRSLRIITWSDSGVTVSHSHPEVSWVVAERSNPLPTFDVHDDEYFIATSSTSALALRYSAPATHLWRCSATEPGLIEQVDSLPTLIQVSEPPGTTNSVSVVPRSGRIGFPTSFRSKTLVVFADALARPVNYLLWLEALENLFLNRPHLGNQWQIVACGRGVEPSLLAGTVPVAHTDHIPESQLARLDLAIMAVPDLTLSSKMAVLGITEISEFSGVTLERAMEEAAS